jgi:hypothetical protein
MTGQIAVRESNLLSYLREAMPEEPVRNLTGNPPFRPFVSGRIVYSIREIAKFVAGIGCTRRAEQSPVRYVRPR